MENFFFFFFFSDNPGQTKGQVTEESYFLVLMQYNRNSGCSKKRSAEYTAKKHQVLILR